MKKKILISVCAVVVLALAVGVFWYYHPTHFTFNDRFVIGSTVDEIVERYGEFYEEFPHLEENVFTGIYRIRDDSSPSLDNSLWYEIRFEDGVAVSVELREGYIGG